MAEEYCNHADSYDVVAVVNKRMSNKKSDLSMNHFQGKKSCHVGYMTVVGWNYPVHYLVSFFFTTESWKESVYEK